MSNPFLITANASVGVAYPDESGQIHGCAGHDRVTVCIADGCFPPQNS